jgi:hypothetical protein
MNLLDDIFDLFESPKAAIVHLGALILSITAGGAILALAAGFVK